MPRFKLCACLVALATVSALPPLHAAPSGEVNPETVVVTAAREASIQNFIQTHAAPSRIDQISRWRTAICPATLGLPDAYNAFVTARVRQVAVNAGAKTSERCTATNVEIVFTTEPQKLMSGIAAKRWQLLGVHFAPQTEAVATVSRPVQAWYVTATRGATGSDSTTGEERVDSAYAGTPPGKAGSRLGSQRSSVFRNVLIVADANKVAGYKIGAVSDYIAMLALAQSQSLQGCEALESILDLMAPDCGRAKPETLTRADTAYLQALYDIDAEADLFVQRNAISARMKAELGVK